MMRNQSVVLVDKIGVQIGIADRVDVHRNKGKLHRAFSIFIFRNDNLLLQRRHLSKLFGDLWTNTCCSHPRPGENIVNAGKRRLKEEFGFACDLQERGSFIYKAHDVDGTEYEYDTVFAGEIEENMTIKPDKNEILEWKWMNIKELKNDLKDNSKKYTPWLSEALQYALGDHP